MASFWPPVIVLSYTIKALGHLLYHYSRFFSWLLKGKLHGYIWVFFTANFLNSLTFINTWNFSEIVTWNLENIFKNLKIIFVLVDGGWSTWGSYSACSVTCDGGRQTRSRTCDNPAPAYNGNSCPESSVVEQSCNTFSCPGKYLHIVTWS